MTGEVEYCNRETIVPLVILNRLRNGITSGTTKVSNERGHIMKRWIVLMMATLFLAGCGAAARESGFYQHDTMYKSGDHLRFSMYGYREVSPNEAQKSNDQKWWGIDVK